MNARPRIVVLGMLTQMPLAGPVWEVLQYLLGFERLGYDAYYVEAHRRTPREFMGDPARAAAFLDELMRRFGLRNRWAYESALDGGRLFGLSEQTLKRLYADCALIVNLNGGTDPLPEHVESGRLVYLETDPGPLEVSLFRGDEKFARIAAAHRAFSTYGLNYYAPDCTLPLPDGIDFLRAPPPVLMDLWARPRGEEGQVFTTVGNWALKGRVYKWTEHAGFLEFLDLPTHTSQALELALVNLPGDDRARLEGHGWRVRAASEVSADPETYRDYIWSSRGELTAVNPRVAHWRTGWFSERSASYLASGKPVIAQDTGFGSYLPTGEGLFSFSTQDGILAALDAVNSDYARHARAAEAIAREFFDAAVVLPRLLRHFGL